MVLGVIQLNKCLFSYSEEHTGHCELTVSLIKITEHEETKWYNTLFCPISRSEMMTSYYYLVTKKIVASGAQLSPF